MEMYVHEVISIDQNLLEYNSDLHVIKIHLSEDILIYIRINTL